MSNINEFGYPEDEFQQAMEARANGIDLDTLTDDELEEHCKDTVKYLDEENR